MKKIISILFLFLPLSMFAQTVISAVYVQSSTATTATIVWTTSTPATSQIRYGYNSGLQFSTNTNYSLVTSHSMTLTLLNASQPYYFAVVSTASGQTTQSSTYEFALCGSGQIPVTGSVNKFYGFGTFSITWNPPSGAVGTPTVCGATLQTTITGNLDQGGAFSSTVGDALKVTPGPGTWTVTVTDLGDLAPVSTTAPLSAQTPDVSAQLQAAASTAGLTGCLANTVTHEAWPSYCASSSAVPAPPSYAVQFANNGATAFQADNTITVNPSLHSVTASAGSLGGLGVFDTSNGLPVFAGSNASGYMGYTDNCSKIVGIDVANVTAGVLGFSYADNTPQSVGTVECGPYGFFDPAKTVASPNVPHLNGGRLQLSPGITYGLQKELDIPYETEILGTAPNSGISGTGNFMEPNSTSFTTNPYSTGHDTAIENFGPPLGTSGAAFVLGAVSADHAINCNNIPSMNGLTELFGQQATQARNLNIYNCDWPLVFGQGGTSGGSQNNWGAINPNVKLSSTVDYPVITGLDLSNAGTGYTSDFALIFTGCTVNPTNLYAQTSGGSLTGKIYFNGPNAGATSYGNCPAASSVTVSFANGSGTGAAGNPIIQTLTTNAGVSLLPGGSARIQQGSVVGGSTELIPNPACYDIEATAGSVLDSYCESALKGVGVGDSTSTALNNTRIVNFSMQPSNQPGYALATFTNHNDGYVLESDAASSGVPWLLIDGNVNGGNIPHMLESNDSGNAGTISLVARNPAGFYVSNDPHIPSNGPIGVSVPNCGSGCTTNEAPAIGYPAKLVGGDAQRMISGDTAQIVGVFSNGQFGTNYDTAHGGTFVTHGKAPCIFDNTPVAGDYVTLGAETPAECHDYGSSPPSAAWVIGIVADPLTGDILVGPSTPSVSGLTATVSSPSTIVDTYVIAQAPTANSLTTSAASSTFTVSTAPQSLSGSGKITINGFTSGTNYAVYRTSIGHSASMTFTALCGPSGGADSVTASGTSAGWSSGMPPTIAFTGGGFSTEPTATVQVAGGQITGIHIVTAGSGCTSNATGTITANTQETGLIGYTQNQTSFIDRGQPALPGTSTPPASAVNGPNIIVMPQLYYGPYTSSSAAGNRVPDTDFKYAAGAYWTVPSPLQIVSGGDTNPNRQSNGIVFTGTGSSPGVVTAYAKQVNLVSGQKYAFSAWMDGHNLTGGTLEALLCATSSCGTIYSNIGPTTAGQAAQTVGIVFTSSVTGSAYIVLDFSNPVAPIGDEVSIAEPMVTASSSLISYIPNDGPGISSAQTNDGVTNPAATSTYTTVNSSIQSDGEWDGADILSSAGSLYVRSQYFLPWAQYANDGKGFYYYESPVQLFPVGGLSPQGSLTTYQMPDPGTAPTITHTGSGSTGSPNYYVRYLDSNGAYTLATPAGVDASGYPTPSGSNCNVITYTAPEPGYSNAAIFRGTNLTWVETPGSGTVSSLSAGDGLHSLSYNDCGTSTEAWSVPTGSRYITPDANNTNDVTVGGRLFTLGASYLSGTTYTYEPIVSTGTQTVSGCSLSAATGGTSAGQFASGTSGTCTVTITPGITTLHGFSCYANDITTTTDHLYQTAVSNTTATIAGTTVSGDVITWGCMAY